MMAPAAFLVMLVALLGTPHLSQQKRRIQRDNVVTSNFNPPRIFPDEKEAVVTSGRNLTLRCEGKQPITWVFPKIGFMDENMPDTESRISVSETPDAAYPYGLLLELFNVSYMDVGYYSCVFNTSDYSFYTIEDLEREGKLSRIYIYVEDPENLMVSSHEVVTAVQYASVIIPCRPTSPRVEVTLYQDGVKVTDSVNFDPHNGFSFVVNSLSTTPYLCKAQRGNQTEDLYIILILNLHTISVPKPQINDSYNGKAVIGGEIHLDCFVRIDPGIAFDLSWTYPNKKMDVSRVMLSNTSMESVTGAINMVQKIGRRSLFIKNVTSEDDGYYECRIIDANQNKNSDKKLIKVLENGTSYISLSEPAGYFNVTVKATRVVRFRIEIDSFPPSKITWFDNHNNAMDATSTKYSINTTSTATLLMIKNVSLDNSGMYRVMADNTIEKKYLNLTLNVEDKPHITLKAEKFYMHGTNAKITCEVAGYPLPEVTWFLQPPKKDTPPEQISETKFENTQINVTTVISVLTIPIERPSLLTCIGKNSEGTTHDSSVFYDTDIENGFGITKIKGPIAIGDNITLVCSGSKFLGVTSLDWYKGFNGSVIENSVDAGIHVTRSSTEYSDQVILSIPQGSELHNGQYACKATSNEDIEPQAVTLIFRKPVAPVIYYTNMNNSAIKLDLGHPNVKFYCKSRGLPVPEIKWYKNGVKITNETRVQVIGDTLLFQYIKVEDDGKYTCVSENRVSSVTRYLELSSDAKEFAPYYATIIALAIFFIGLVVFLVWKIRREQKIRKELSIAGLLNFEEGATESLNPELGIDEQADLLPYDKKWEFPREKLKLGKQLGSGAFGVVMKAEAHGIVSDEEYTKVAVKMVKKSAESAFIKALASELKIMVHLGKHLNVVNLLGACTKNVTKRELYVIVEYCRFGNIHNYLLRHRCKFIDQVVPGTDAIDSTIGHDIINRAYSISSNKSGGSAMDDFRESVNSAGGMDTNNTVISMVPNGTDTDGVIMSNGSLQPEWRSNYRGDYYKKDVRPISTQDLLCWSFQVARGMEYLANRKVLHGDLAARNILLADDNIVKICDFGLAKSMYKSDNYKKKGDGPLPVKWMAIESIRDRVFSTQSDVWSYGIVLWEIFSLASTPYPGMEADEKLFNKLVEGYRMEKPKYANKQIYNTMLECWTSKPVHRPSFTKLAERLGDMLEDSVRKHYVDLNDPYVDMNNRWMAERGDSDYLAMMNSPDYGNIASSNDKHEYVNDPFGGPTKVNPLSPDDTDAEGYLCMSPAKNSVINQNPPLFDFSSSPTSARRSKTNAAGSEVEAQQTELIPMLSMNGQAERPGSDSDIGESNPASPNSTHTPLPSDLTVAFSNPSYQQMFKVNPDKQPNTDLMISKDNYVNMSQKDSGFCDDIDVMNPPAAFSNPSYVAMSISDSKKALPNIYTNMPSTVT